MKVLLFYPEKLPPKNYGGVERVVLWLAKGLQELGHAVSVAAREDSVLPNGASLVGLPANEKNAADAARRAGGAFDILHVMAPLSAMQEQELRNRFGLPVITTIHGNGRSGETYSRNAVFLSRNHAERHAASEYVHNGVDPAECRFRPVRAATDPLLFFSRTHLKTKNLRGAVTLCRRHDQPLIVGGGQRPYGLRGRLAVESAWNRWTGNRRFRVMWTGEVSGARKAELFERARAFLFPVLWDEPFGLVVVESLLAGTPVIASRRGSLTELIPDSEKKTGRLCETPEDWDAALRLPLADFDPEACRAHALKSFTHRTMAERYVALYRRVIAGEYLQPQAPEVVP